MFMFKFYKRGQILNKINISLTFIVKWISTLSWNPFNTRTQLRSLILKIKNEQIYDM